MDTRRPPRIPQPQPYAGGIYVQKRTYLFQELPDRLLLLGRAARCHIRVQSSYVSHVHAVLERRDGATFLINKSELGYTFVDGAQVEEPTPLRVGNLIVLGASQLVATNDNGWFPINNVAGITDLCRKAVELCGGQRAAERWLDCDHSTIRRRIHRSEGRRTNRGS